jgi:orotidine-5'-phosphate decarboxylase
MQPKDRLIFALDVPGLEEARRYLELLEGEVGVFKVGLELFLAAGPEAARLAAGYGRLFLDLKLHDIPETMRRSSRRAAELGAEFLSVHAESERGLAAAVEGAPHTKVLAVTLLTSSSPTEAGEVCGLGPGDIAVARARLAERAGCAGVVCAGNETARLKEVFPGLLVVNPGIRPAWAAERADQRRISTPAEAIRAGADYIVVGRPIRDHSSPRQAARLIAEEIATALKGPAA